MDNHASTSIAPKVSSAFRSCYQRNVTRWSSNTWHGDWILVSISEWCSESFRGDPFSRCVYSHLNRTAFSALVILPHMATFGQLWVSTLVLPVLACRNRFYSPLHAHEIRLIPLQPQFLALTPMNRSSWLTIRNTQNTRIHINPGSTLKIHPLWYTFHRTILVRIWMWFHRLTSTIMGCRAWSLVLRKHPNPSHDNTPNLCPSKRHWNTKVYPNYRSNVSNWLPTFAAKPCKFFTTDKVCPNGSICTLWVWLLLSLQHIAHNTFPVSTTKFETMGIPHHQVQCHQSSIQV